MKTRTNESQTKNGTFVGGWLSFWLVRVFVFVNCVRVSVFVFVFVFELCYLAFTDTERERERERESESLGASATSKAWGCGGWCVCREVGIIGNRTDFVRERDRGQREGVLF